MSMQTTDQELIHALQARTQGYRYTQLELVNWLCTTFDITLERSEAIVAELGLHK